MRAMKLLLAALSIGVISAGASSHAQSIADQLKERTGLDLREAPSEGPVAFTLPPGVVLTDQLSLREALSIALWNNSALQADLANINVTRADLVAAGLFRNPSFSMLLPVGPKPFEFLLAWPIEELWQRRRRIKAARLNVEATATGLVQNGLNLVRNVRVAHTDLWLAQERARTLEEAAELHERIHTMTEKRKANGDATGLDATVSLANARSASQVAGDARDEIGIAHPRLIHLMGMRRENRMFAAVLDAGTPALPELTVLLEMAMGNRPDLRAAELTIEMNAERAKWERSRTLAMVAPALSTKGVGSAGIRTGPGINMDVPLLSRNQGQSQAPMPRWCEPFEYMCP